MLDIGNCSRSSFHRGTDSISNTQRPMSNFQVADDQCDRSLGLLSLYADWGMSGRAFQSPNRKVLSRVLRSNEECGTPSAGGGSASGGRCSPEFARRRANSSHSDGVLFSQDVCKVRWNSAYVYLGRLKRSLPCFRRRVSHVFQNELLEVRETASLQR
jgi:hypothetical protein